MIITTYLSALIIGLSASLHCVGMCGSIASSFGIVEKKNYYKIFLYNFGRVFSYTLLGILVGFLGQAFASQINQSYGLSVLRIVASLTLIYLAFKIGNFLPNLKIMPSFFARVERFFTKIGSKIDKYKSNWARFFSGMVWGLLPCSMVYSTLFFAFSSSASFASYNEISSGLIMLSFGLGTLPSMILMGIVGKGLLDKTKTLPVLSKIFALIILFMAFLNIFLHPLFSHMQCH